MNVVALAGGVGGAKLADGLQRVVGKDLTVIVNTGDDFEWHGLRISPDLDTVMYTLAGIANSETGWGIRDDTFNSLEMTARYGEDAWFRLGDRDLATHLLRTQMLREGMKLSAVTRRLSQALGIPAAIVPMTDQAVSTLVNTDEGELEFQEYFVHRRWQPAVKSVRFAGIEAAIPGEGAIAALDQAGMVVVCPSNPFVSVAPILGVQGLREAIQRAAVPKIAVSPIVGGDALKGPAAKMFSELGIEPSALAVAQRYTGLIDAFVLDQVDEAQGDAIRALGFAVMVTDTVMKNTAEREKLAREIVNWGMELKTRRLGRQQ